MAGFDQVLDNYMAGRAAGQAIFGQESNYGRNPAARGNVMQVMPATFQRYALPGEVASNPQDSYNVGQRIIDTYAQRYGGDPSRIATAYFSGEGNVAPPGSDSPYRRNPADSSGKRTSAYVGDILNRMAQGTGGGSMSFDDALNHAYPSQAGAQAAAMSFDDALNQAFPPPAPVQDAAAPQLSTSDVQRLAAQQQPIPIDPYAADKPESPMQGDNRLWRDLAGMAQMMPVMGMRVPLGPLARMLPFGLGGTAPEEPAAPQGHWSSRQPRDARGRFTGPPK